MDTDRARELLKNERDRIERALAEVAAQAPERVADEPGDGGSETLYQDEFDAGRAEDLQGQFAALERAEARLADGTYGRSILSGEPIPDARLEALPTAELTVDEQRDALNG